MNVVKANVIINNPESTAESVFNRKLITNDIR